MRIFCWYDRTSAKCTAGVPPASRKLGLEILPTTPLPHPSPPPQIPPRPNAGRAQERGSRTARLENSFRRHQGYLVVAAVEGA